MKIFSIIIGTALASVAQAQVWDFTGTAAGSVKVVNEQGQIVSSTPASMAIESSFTVNSAGVMTAAQVDGFSSQWISTFAAEDEITFANQNGVIVGGNISAPSLGFNVYGDVIDYVTEFGDSAGAVTYEQLTGTGMWTDTIPAPEIDIAHSVAALTLLCGFALILKSRRRN